MKAALLRANATALSNSVLSHASGCTRYGEAS
jgi:hypothetical protein